MSEFRKRVALPFNDRDAFSTRLRYVRDLTMQGQTAAALTAINGYLATESHPLRQSNLISFVGDNERRLRKFADAIQAYENAINLAAGHPQAWFRPTIGVIISLLQNAEIPAAAVRGNLAVQTATRYELEFQARTNIVIEKPVTLGLPLVAGPRPPRPSVVARRVGFLFLEEGELELARDFFTQAITLEPDGSASARIGLAEISLRQGLPLDAKNWGWSALQIGRFQRKTLPVLPILLSAIYQLGEPFDQRILDGFAQAKPTVQDRATLEIARGLRSKNIALWKDVASGWLNLHAGRNAVIAAELGKLLQAAGRLEQDLSAQLARSAALLATPRLSPTEFLSCAKEQTRAGLLLGQNVDVLGFSNQAAQTYGEPWRARAIHCLAGSCLSAQRADLASSLLEQNLNNLPHGNVEWSQSMWALARIRFDSHDYAGAANLYRTVADSADVSPRFRAQSQIEWAKIAVATGDTTSANTEATALVNSLSNTNDYRLLLDIGRILFNGPLSVSDLAEQLFTRGESLALDAIETTSQPEELTRLLCYVAWRQLDFQKPANVIAVWRGLTTTERELLWSSRSEYWEYLGLVYQALLRTGSWTEAEKLASDAVYDSSTPSAGIAILGSKSGLYKLRCSEYAAAFKLFADVIARAPHHVMTSHAYYWLALVAWKRGDRAKARAHADMICRLIGTDVGLKWRARLLSKGICLVAELDPARLPTTAVVPRKMLISQIDVIRTDLYRSPSTGM